jgi:Domain of unknown function (DUF4190)
MTPWYDAGAPKAPRNGLGIASLALGLLAALTTLLLIGFVFGIAAVGTGLVALARVRRGTASNRAPAVVGIVLGGLSIVLDVGFLAWVIWEAKTRGCLPTGHGFCM